MIGPVWLVFKSECLGTAGRHSACIPYAVKAANVAKYMIVSQFCA